MNKLLVAALFSFAMFNADAAVMTFDDAYRVNEEDWTGYAYYIVPVSGLTIRNVGVYSANPLPSGYNNNIVSGDKLAFNRSERTASIESSSGDNWYFHSVWLGAGWNNSLNIELIGYVDGVVAYSRQVVVDSLQPTFLSLSWHIDQLTIRSYGGVPAGYLGGSGSHFVMDDFRYRLGAIPEPSTYSMLGLGLCLAGFTARRRKTHLKLFVV